MKERKFQEVTVGNIQVSDGNRGLDITTGSPYLVWRTRIELFIYTNNEAIQVKVWVRVTKM